MLGIPWLAVELLAYQLGLYCIQWVHYNPKLPSLSKRGSELSAVIVSPPWYIIASNCQLFQRPACLRIILMTFTFFSRFHFWSFLFLSLCFFMFLSCTSYPSFLLCPSSLYISSVFFLFISSCPPCIFLCLSFFISPSPVFFISPIPVPLSTYPFSYFFLP